MRTLSTLLFLLTAVPLGALALGVLLAGWIAVGVLSVTPLVVPALLGFRALVGATARLEAWLANELLGTEVQPPFASPGPAGYWRRGVNVLQDGAFWRQQAYLLFRLSIGFGLAVAEWTLLAVSLGVLTLPIWYRWSDTRINDTWRLDTLPRSLLGIPVGILGLVLTLALLRPLASWSRSLAASLLGGDAGAPQPSSRLDRNHALRVATYAFAALNALLAAIWALTGHGYFWPEWTLLPLGLPLAVWFVALRTRGLAKQVAIVGVFATFFTLCWAVTGTGYFWPAWPILGVVAAAVLVRVLHTSRRRIARLEETRAGAVVQQESELARIERDLHDGAQARLVALGMSLGMAEQKLASDPVAAQALLAEARRGTQEALEELRNLARGIHPPVLADRGLGAAIDTLAHHTPLRVNVAVDMPQRPPQAVETAAYFVVAEALANSGKHAHADQVDIAIRRDAGCLVIEVVDDGSGGADPGGGGLTGLARRVEALDGTLDVTSPAGGPTTVRAVIPCES